MVCGSLCCHVIRNKNKLTPEQASKFLASFTTPENSNDRPAEVFNFAPVTAIGPPSHALFQQKFAVQPYKVPASLGGHCSN